MQIAKSKGFEDIGHMENKLRDFIQELGMVRHIESIRRSQLQEENELLKKQLQEWELQGGDKLPILEGKQQQKGPLVDNELVEKQQQE